MLPGSAKADFDAPMIILEAIHLFRPYGPVTTRSFKPVALL